MSGPGEPADPDEPAYTGPDEGVPDIAEELMAGFRRTPRGVSARFTSAQAGIVRNLVGQVAELVGGPEAAAAPQAPSTGPGAAWYPVTRR